MAEPADNKPGDDKPGEAAPALEPIVKKKKIDAGHAGAHGGFHGSEKAGGWRWRLATPSYR